MPRSVRRVALSFASTFALLVAPMPAKTSAPGPRESTDRTRYGWLADYATTNEAAVFDHRFVRFARGVAPPFRFHDGIRYPGLADRFVAGLGGPPDAIRRVDDRYLELGACVPHDCGSKSFLWVDPIDDLAIGAVAEVSYSAAEAEVTVFSRSSRCDRIPVAFRSALTRWIEARSTSVVRARFVDPTGRVDAACPLFRT